MVQNLRFFLAKTKEWFLFFILLFFAITISLSASLSESFLQGVSLWFSSVLPALFPYAIITTLISGLSVINGISKIFSPLTIKLFNVNGSVFYALFIGLLSGHPTGVKTVCDLYKSGALSHTESVRAASICSTASPVFLISCVGNIAFKNSLFGICLFICNVLTAVSIGIIFSFYNRKDKTHNPLTVKSAVKPSFSDSVSKSVISVLVVGGFIVFFYVLTDLLQEFNLLTPFIKILTPLFGEKPAKGIITGLLECTKGFKIIAQTGIGPQTLPICAFLTGFGGVSVICQSVAFLKEAKIKTAPFVFAKILGAVLCVNFALICSVLFFN